MITNVEVIVRLENKTTLLWRNLKSRLNQDQDPFHHHHLLLVCHLKHLAGSGETQVQRFRRPSLVPHALRLSAGDRLKLVKSQVPAPRVTEKITGTITLHWCIVLRKP